MSTDPFADILRQEGFVPVGRLDYRLALSAWWHPAADRRLQVIVLAVGRSALIRGDKSYYLVSVSPEGETWARDVGLLHDWLESHFPEVRIALSHFRDVPPELARTEAARRMTTDAPTRPLPTVERVAALQRRLQEVQGGMRSAESLLALSDVRSDLLTGYVRGQGRAQKAEAEHLKASLDRERERLGVLQHLQREYQRKGSAAVYTFAVGSNVQCAADPAQFRDALRSVVKELTDLHRFQVMQKLEGGRLNIRIAEATEPAMTWVEQWLGGALTPTQLHRLGPELSELRESADRHVMVTPDEPITVDGDAVRHAEKRVAARFVSDVLARMDKTDSGVRQDADLTPGGVPADALPLVLGHRLDDAGRIVGPVAFPLAQMVHLYVSGTTGSGKSYLARVLIEEAAGHDRLGVLVLDPRNQSVGLLAAEDRPMVLERYAEFGMRPGQARGLPFAYHAPGLAFAKPLPADLRSLATGRSIVSFKGLDDAERCALAADVLDAAFDGCSAAESDGPRLLVVVDEAQLFTRRRCDESAKEAAGRAERALDRIAREGRKFGVVLALVSQTMKDFSYELASVRQMTTTKVFLRNSDREIEYAADIVGDGRLLVQLPTGTALVHNGNWGVVRVRVRPPLTKVFEPAEGEVRRLVGSGKVPATTLSTDAQRLLAVIRQHGASPGQPLNMSRAAELAGISSKRQLADLTEELERAGVIRTRRLPERGRPRVIEMVDGRQWPVEAGDAEAART